MPTKLIDLNPKPHLRPGDLDGPVNLTVMGWGHEKVWNPKTNSEEDKPALYFYGEKRYLIFNPTNQKIAEVLGFEYVEDLIGKTITLYAGVSKRKTKTILIAETLPPQDVTVYTVESAMGEANEAIGPDENGLVYFQEQAHFEKALGAVKFDVARHGKNPTAWGKAIENIVKMAKAKRAKGAVEAKPQPQEPAHPTEEALDDQPPTDQPAEAHADALPVAA